MTTYQQHIDIINKANKITNQHTIYAAGVGLIPFPLVDMAALLGIQLNMVKSIADLYQIEFKQHLAKSLIGSLISSTGSVGLTKLIPGLGTLLGGVTVSATGAAATYALGRIFTQHFDQGGTLLDFNPASARAFFQKEYQNGQAYIKKQNLTEVKEANNNLVDAKTIALNNKLIATQIKEFNNNSIATKAKEAKGSLVDTKAKEKALLIKENEELMAALKSLQKDIDALTAKTRKTTAKKPTTKKTTVKKTAKKKPAPSKKVIDLTVIEGIGPKIAAALKAGGVDSMLILSKTAVPKLQELLKNAKGNFNFADPTSWPKQAALAADNKLDELKKLQDELIGGRTKRK